MPAGRYTPAYIPPDPTMDPNYMPPPPAAPATYQTDASTAAPQSYSYGEPTSYADPQQQQYGDPAATYQPVSGGVVYEQAAPQPGLGGTPAPYSASQYYGGANSAPPDYGRLNDPNYVVSYYPSTGDAPTAVMTGYQWEKGGRQAPSGWKNVPFPADSLSPPANLATGGRPPTQEDIFKPGPPRNYIPGSTYIPQDPEPDPRKPYFQRKEEYKDTHGMGVGTVPGSSSYHRTVGDYNEPFSSPGLGSGSAYSPGPLSRWGRDAAPQNRNIPQARNLGEPQERQPGSTYIPDLLGTRPLGDPVTMYRPPVASELYGGSQSITQRPPSTSRVDTIYPASGDPETMRSTGYLGSRGQNSTVYGDEAAPNRGRVYTRTDTLGEEDDDGDVEGGMTQRMVLRNPDVTTPPTADVFAQMERGRQARRPQPLPYLEQLRHLFGSPSR